MPTLPQLNYSGAKQPTKNKFQTPPIALDVITPYLEPKRDPISGLFTTLGLKNVWEPSAGEGYIVRTLQSEGYTVYASDIDPQLDPAGVGHDFLDRNDKVNFHYDMNSDIIITNPPFSEKQKFLAECISLVKKFALLMPSTMLTTAAAIPLITKHEIEIIQVYPRICYKAPYKGWAWIQNDPNKDRYGLIVETAAQFPSAWYTRGLNIGRRLTYVNLKPPRGYYASLELSDLKKRGINSKDDEILMNKLMQYIQN